jgi:hypothetical protein
MNKYLLFEWILKDLLARQSDGMALEKKWLMEYPQCLYTAARRSMGASHEPIGNDDSPDGRI